jgi:hypothetical protein
LYSAHLLPTGVEEETAEIPEKLTLFGNYPNPFNSRTMVSLFSPYDSPAVITIYDTRGRKYLEKNIQIKSGANTIPLELNRDDSRKISSGIYYYTVQLTDNKITGKMLYLK